MAVNLTLDPGGEEVLSAVEELAHETIGVELVLAAYALIALILLAIWAEKNHVPSSIAAMAAGALVGVLLRATGVDQSSSLGALRELIFFDNSVFYYILLPPIIFHAGFSMSGDIFFGNLGTILLFAVVGTALTMGVVGSVCQYAGAAGWFADQASGQDALDFSSPRDAFTFGALISATDPVATLSIMGAFNVDPMLFTLVAGESVLNDAVAIVLVQIVSGLPPAAYAHPLGALGAGLASFASIVAGSLGVGLAVAGCSATLFKRLDLLHLAAFEVSLLLLCGYSAYVTAEALRCSGILALFACGVLMGRFHVRNMSGAARGATGVALKSISHLAETFVFAYMGLDLIAPRGALDDVLPEGAELSELAFSAPQVASNRRFVAFAVVVVPLTRALVVPPLCALANTWRGRSHRLSGREALFLVFCGLRGAIAFALAKVCSSGHRRAIVAATMAVVVFTTVVLGGLTRSMLAYLGIGRPAPPLRTKRPRAGSGHVELELEALAGDHDQPAAMDETAGSAASTGSEPAELAPAHDFLESSPAFRMWRAFEERHLQPRFGGPPPGARGH